MNRRDAIARVGLLFGGTVIGANAFLAGCVKRAEETLIGVDFNPDVVAMLDEVGETILPTTASSPGAKASAIGEFMKIIVTDCYEEKNQRIFMEGIGLLNKSSNEKYGDDFVELAQQDRHALLVSIDQEAKDYQSKKKADDPEHYFTMMKQLTLWGYFTSEVGSKQALRYVPVPGRFEGCVDYKKGDRAFSAI